MHIDTSPQERCQLAMVNKKWQVFAARKKVKQKMATVFCQEPVSQTSSCDRQLEVFV